MPLPVYLLLVSTIGFIAFSNEEVNPYLVTGTCAILLALNG